MLSAGGKETFSIRGIWAGKRWATCDVPRGIHLSLKSLRSAGDGENVKKFSVLFCNFGTLQLYALTACQCGFGSEENAQAINSPRRLHGGRADAQACSEVHLYADALPQTVANMEVVSARIHQRPQTIAWFDEILSVVTDVEYFKSVGLLRSWLVSTTLSFHTDHSRGEDEGVHGTRWADWAEFICNLRSQHFTFHRWKLVSLKEIDLIRRLFLNLNLGEMRTHFKQTFCSRPWPNICSYVPVTIFITHKKSKGQVWKTNVVTNRHTGRPSRRRWFEHVNRHERIQSN